MGAPNMESLALIRTSFQINASMIYVALPAFLLLAIVYSNSSGKRKHLPPGPKGLPIIGNVHQILGSNCLWLKLTTWSATYGNVFYCNLAGHDVVVLNNNKAAFDLLSRRSKQGTIMVIPHTGGCGLNFLQRNDRWRRSRRAAHEALKPSMLDTYHPTQMSESIRLIERLLGDPENWQVTLRRVAASSMLRMLYGVLFEEDSNEEDLRLIFEFTEQILKSAAPDAHLVEYFSWMEYLPRWLAPWRVMAENWHVKGDALFIRLYQDVKARVDKGVQRPCIASKMVEDPDNDLTDREAAWVLGTLYAAGSDSTPCALSWLFLAVILHPEIQEKAQRDLDKVTGRDRMPTFADSDTLPYIYAIIQELLRWRPVAPTAMPHVTEKDDSYEGYYIPKGTLCIPNVWAINHDPNLYGSDADSFRPERFMNDTGTALTQPLPETHEENHGTFGYGRRICVGRHMSRQSLFILVATILWAFKIEAAEDKAGNKVLPRDDDYEDDGLILHPGKFRCKVTPRFPCMLQIVQQAKDNDGTRSWT